MIQTSIGILTGMGIFLILADLFRIPYFKTSKAFQNLIKRQRKKTSTIELLNTDHLHNHFVINSVSYVDGMKYYDTPKTYYNILRKISDEMCRENNLHVIENPQHGRSKH